MRSMLASPEFNSESDVDVWTRKHKAAEPLYDILKMIVDHCVSNNVVLESGSKDLTALGKQLIEEIGRENEPGNSGEDRGS
jgi:hypothetical protein